MCSSCSFKKSNSLYSNGYRILKILIFNLGVRFAKFLPYFKTLHFCPIFRDILAPCANCPMGRRRFAVLPACRRSHALPSCRCSAVLPARPPFSCAAKLPLFSCAAKLPPFSCAAKLPLFSWAAQLPHFSCAAKLPPLSCAASRRPPAHRPFDEIGFSLSSLRQLAEPESTPS